jgi:hypothetical protein
MFRLRLSGIAAALIACTVLAPDAFAAPVNRLVNGGFEESVANHPWMPTGWDTSRAGVQTAFFGRDTLIAHGGKWAANVANLSAMFPLSHNWSQRVIVGPKEWGKDLVFSVWTKTTSLEGRAYILLQGYRDTISYQAAQWGMDRDSARVRMMIKNLDDPLVSLGWARASFTDAETPWVRREVRIFCAPLVNAVFVRVGLQGTGQVYLDDASLTVEPARPAKEPPVGVNLLADPGFEGDLLPWEISVPPFEGMYVRRDSTEAHSGRASLIAGSGEGQWIKTRTGVCQPLCNRALGGKRVRMSGWVKTDSLKSLAYAMVFAHTPRGIHSVAQPEQFGQTTPWTKTTIEMDLPADTYLVWAWFSHDAPRPGIVHWDDCSLEVIGKAKTPGPPPIR